ncbi:recombinase family protein [Agrococcus sediminis]|uniref:recombinase family protein n=1 Tax=Agrococcus sediminis TaxID=2599924 RepID=UPI00343BDE44
MVKTSAARPLALAYVRVSTDKQAEAGASLAAQREALTREADRKGFAVEFIEEHASAKTTKGRPLFMEALARLDRGEAKAILAMRLDRLSRSVADFAALMERADRKGWGIVLADGALDTTTPAGRFSANVLASAAQLERELIAARTREGMAQRKAEGATFGRKVAEGFLPTYERVLAMRADGQSMNAIAAALNSEGIATARGGKWHASTVRAMLTSETAKNL